MPPKHALDAKDLLGVNPTHAGVIDEIRSLVVGANALLQGHFELQGGRHSEYFIRFKQVGRERPLVERAAELLVKDASWVKGTTRVLGAESAGFYLAQAIGRRLDISTAIATIDHRRRPTENLRTGDVNANDRVVIATDLVTTGSSLRTLIELVHHRGAQVSGVAVFGVLDTATYTKVLNQEKLPGSWLVSSLWPTWDAGPSCPLCAQGQEFMPALELN